MRGRKQQAVLRVALATLLLGACSPSAGERIGRVQAWKARPTPANLERIRSFMKDPDRDVRVIALEALVSEKTEDALTLSIEALADEDPYVRTAAARCIGELRASSAVSDLVAHLAADPDPQVRRRAAESVAIIGGADAVAALLRALDDKAPEVRLAAVRGAGALDPDTAYESLARIVVEDPDWQTRVHAARALSRASRPEAWAALEAARGDPNEFVRAAASAALRQRPAGEAPTP